jgi:hypothetical protein
MRLLPMPGSPDNSTTWPSPSCARFQRSIKRPSSCSRPTKPVSRPLRTASKRPSDADTPSIAQAATGSANACKSSGQVRRLADHRLLLCGALADEIADHHEPGGDAHAHLQLADGGRVEPADRGDDVETGADGPLGIVFVGARIAEVNQHAVAHVFGDETVEAANPL